MEFKGTKGKWCVGETRDVKNIETRKVIADCNFFGDNKEVENANAQLIAHAPEMLERLKEQNIDLKILKSNLIDASKGNARFEGYPNQVQKWIDANNELIKSATEI